MIEITGFLLKHLYELMADDYDAAGAEWRLRRRDLTAALAAGADLDTARSQSGGASAERRQRRARDQDANQEIVLFLANNQLPDLVCETFIELLFVCVFLAVSWIFVMIVQLHCQQLEQPAKHIYCNTKFLNSLMYCNNPAGQARAR